MAEKLITSRVKQRFDTLTNWQAIWETFKPLKGEVCKIQIPADTAVTGLRTSSSVRVMTKTGDGETTLEKLPWDSAIGADETQLSKGTDSTTSKTLSHGSKFTAITETSVDGHKITDTTTTYTLPSETAVVTDQLTGTAQTPAHGGSISVVTAVAKGDSSHNVDVTTTSIKLPAESTLKKGADATASATLTHGGTFKAVTGTAASAHTVTDTVTTFTMPAETELSVDQGTATTATLSHSGTVTVISGVTKGDSGHNLDIAKTTIKLPGETSVSVDTLTAETGTLTHGGTFTALTAAAKGSSSHNIDVTPTTFTLPAETTLKKGTDATATAVTLKHGGSFTAMTNTTVSGHTVTDTNTTFTLPSETTLSKGNDSNTTETLTHGGTFTAVTDTTVNGHQITDVTKTFTLPTETAVTVDQGEATSTNLSHGGTVTVLTGVTKGDTSHNIDVAKTKIKLPSETSLSKGTDATGTATTLTHGGKFSAVTDTSVSGHKITDTVTEFTLPAETTLSKGSDATGTATTLTHGGKFKAVTDTTVSGHKVTDVVTEFTMPSETAVSVDTLSANTKTLTHGETFTVLTAAAKGGSSHNIDVTPTTFTLPAMPTGAMIFKGTLGTDGSATTLPTSPVAGWSYKVITAGTYAETACTVGDMLVYDGTEWVLIPSGDDEKQGTVTSVKTGQGLSGGTITTSGTIKHVDTTRTDTTSTATGSHGGAVTVVDGVTTNSMGHVTAVNVKTVTLPSETTLTKGTDSSTATTPTSLSHGGTFTVMTDTSVSGHQITDKNTTFKLPSETAVVTDQLTGTAKTLTHGGTVDVITAVAKGNSSHNVDVTKTTLTLPAETAVNVTATTGSALTPKHSGKVTVVTGVAKGTNSHDVTVTTQDITLPAETSLSKGTDATAASTLSHGGTFTAITETTVSGHKITDTTTTYTLPAETKLSKGTDATAAKTLEFGKTFTAVTNTAVDNHKITDTTTTFTMPSETTLSKGTDATAAVTLTHGGTFTAVTDTSVSGHKITDTTTTFTMPAETAISVDQGTATSSKPAHGGTVTVLTGVTKGDSSHNIDVAKTTITFPSETTLSKATDATAATQTLSHGGTFTALTDLTVSGHAITDKPTTFTLPSETTLSVTDNESGNAVTDVTVSGHAITLKRGKTFLTAHPTISVGTDSTSAATLAHSGTFTAVDSVTRDGNGHVTKINTKTYTLPADSDTKNTAGSSNTSSKIYLVGATSQATNPVTYSHDTAYVGTDGCVYSGGAKTFSTSYAPEAYLQWGGRSISGDVGPISAALSSEHSANRLAFLNPDALALEYSNDGGSTWTDAYWDDAHKVNHVTTSSSITVGSAPTVTTDHKSRVTLTAQDGTTGYVYTRPHKLLINVSSAGHGMSVTIEYKRGASGASWATLGTYPLSGWSGWNDIDISGLSTLGGGKTQTTNNWYLRFTYHITSVNSNHSNTKAFVLGMRLFGTTCWNPTSNMGETGHLYSYDSDQNAYFPAGLNTAGQLTENGTRVSKVGHTHSVTAAGTVSQPTFTGTAASHNHTFTGTEAGHTHTFSGTAASHDHSFTGTKHKHTFTGTAVTSGGASATESIYQITGVGTLPNHSYTAPSLTATVSNQCLTLSWSAGAHSFSAGSLPTRSSITVAKAHTHSVTAAGTLDEIAATGTVGSKSITPAGTIAETKVTPAGTISSKSLTPAGTVSKPTFTGSAVTSGGSSN